MRVLFGDFDQSDLLLNESEMVLGTDIIFDRLVYHRPSNSAFTPISAVVADIPRDMIQWGKVLQEILANNVMMPLSYTRDPKAFPFSVLPLREMKPLIFATGLKLGLISDMTTVDDAWPLIMPSLAALRELTDILTYDGFTHNVRSVSFNAATMSILHD